MTTPPPQGQNPYGQQPAQDQNPYGQQPAPGQPQQGVPPQGFPPQGPYAAPGMPGAAPEQPVKNKKNILRIAGAVIVLAVIAGSWWASQDDAKAAAVGDCMHRGSDDDNNPDLEVVECGSDKAEYKVLAKIEGKFTSIVAQSKCEAEAEGFKYAYTETGGSKSFVLCLDDA
ncbi:hypothetical protein G3I34_30400 [Streptomyces sp. SID8014]|uniref:LppU/SCO3897 family protein n=1 Tax=Streptomyces sp. SID8014 TaxID=2706097 RepID=UPI0013BA2C78|nr:hypothetical protein [Streptomyces sp. SID8014]